MKERTTLLLKRKHTFLFLFKYILPQRTSKRLGKYIKLKTKEKEIKIYKNLNSHSFDNENPSENDCNTWWFPKMF